MKYETWIYEGPDFTLENGYRENPDGTITQISESFDSPRREVTRTRDEMAAHLRVCRQHQRERAAQLNNRPATRKPVVFDYRSAGERRRAARATQQ